MVNIILISILISLIISYFTKRSTLSCGLFGFSGDMKEFNWDKFKILGLQNDKRGGDSCGIATDKHTTHYFERLESEFEDVLLTLKFNELKDEKFVFGQTRKASKTLRAYTGEEYTQPLALIVDDKMVGVGMHNGTLTNHDELISSFNVPELVSVMTNGGEIKNVKPNDSLVLLYELIVNKNYKILKKYEGAATLVWYSIDDDEMYLYSGASYSRYLKGEERERPMFILENEKQKLIWFSSIKNSLKYIDDYKDSKIYPIEVNTLYTIKNGEIKSLERGGDFDRSEIGKLPPVIQSNFKALDFPRKNTYNTEDNEDGKILKKYKVWAIDGKHSIMDRELNGIYHVTTDSEIILRDGNEYDLSGIKYESGPYITNPMYFINGYNIDNSTDFNLISRQIKKFNLSEIAALNVILKYVKYPININGIYEIWNDKTGEAVKADGEYLFKIQKITKTFENGRMVHAKLLSNVEFKEMISKLKSPSNEDDENDDIINDEQIESLVECSNCNGTGVTADGSWCYECSGSGHKTKHYDEVENEAYQQLLAEELYQSVDSVIEAIELELDKVVLYSGTEEADKLISYFSKMENMLTRKRDSFLEKNLAY